MTWTVDEIYFQWLTEHVNFNYGRPNGKTYIGLMGQLHTKEFVWVVANDDNRLEDAAALRHQFLNESGITNYEESFLLGDPPLSILEVIIALSERCAFAGGGDPRDWAWRLIENLELHKMADPEAPRQAEKIDDILETLIWRNYEPDGVGGFFPLNHPEENQTKVEIWYQMNAYIDERLEQ